jgi:hypothetical protein
VIPNNFLIHSALAPRSTDSETTLSVAPGPRGLGSDYPLEVSDFHSINPWDRSATVFGSERRFVYYSRFDLAVVKIRFDYIISPWRITCVDYEISLILPFAGLSLHPDFVGHRAILPLTFGHNRGSLQ